MYKINQFLSITKVHLLFTITITITISTLTITTTTINNSNLIYAFCKLNKLITLLETYQSMPLV